MKRLGFSISKFITYEFSDENRSFFVVFEYNNSIKLFNSFLVINGIEKYFAIKKFANSSSAIDIYKEYIENQKQKIIKNKLL